METSQEIYDGIQTLRSDVVRRAVEIREDFTIPVATSDVLFLEFRNIVSRICDYYYQCISEGRTSDSVRKPEEISDMFDQCIGNTCYKSFDKMHPSLRPRYTVLEKNGKKIYYIPIAETLTVLLRSPVYKFVCFNNIFSNDFFKSEYFRSHFISQHSSRHVIYIKIFLDDFEIVNPIGSARGFHKLTGIYFQVMNIPDFLNSHLNHIHLITLFPTRWFPGQEFQDILRHISDELNNLFRDNISDELPFPVMCVFVCGDNAAIHQVAGLQRNFNSGYICRHCKISYEELSAPIFEPPTNLRSETDYESGSEGVLVESAFNHLPCVKREFLYPPDIMHDVLEGVSYGVVCVFFEKLVVGGFMSLNCIKSRISEFDFDGFDSKPHTRFERRHIRKRVLPLNASQMLTLILNIPLIFHEAMEMEEEAFVRLTNLHVEIVRILLCPSFHADNDFYFLSVIIEHNALYINLMSDHIFHICKLHYLYHYSSWLKYVGSLRPLWNMRFEALHSYFKRRMRGQRQFRNPSYSLTLRYTYKKAVNIQSESFCEYRHEFKSYECNVARLKDEERALINEVSHMRLSFKCCEKLVIHGYLYSEKYFTPVRTSGIRDLICVQISRIVNFDNEWYVMGRQHLCHFIPQHCCYEIVEKLQFAMFPIKSLLSHPSVPVRQGDSGRFIILQYNLEFL